MTFAPKNFWLIPTLAFIAMSAFGLTVAAAGEKIQFSSPASPVISSNIGPALSATANPFNPNRGGLRQVQDDLFGPLRNSMNFDDLGNNNNVAVPVFNAPRQAPTKHERELLEQRRNWAFTDLNDLFPEPSADPNLGLLNTDTLETKPVSLIERFYDNAGQQSLHKQNVTLPGIYGSQQAITNLNNTGIRFLSKIYSPNDPVIRTIIAAELSSRQNPLDTASFENASFPQENRQEILAAQKRMDEFRHLLDPSLPAGKEAARPDLFNTGNGNALLSPNNPSPSPELLAHRNFNHLTGATDPTLAALHSPVNDDPTAAALGLPNPTPSPKPVVAPTARSIQKMFDPFGANQPKPKF